MDVDRIIKTLSGGLNMPRELSSELEMLDELNLGLPYEALAMLNDCGIVSEGELKTFIAPRTLSRRKGKSRLSREESDLVARLLRIYEFAVKVFGDDEKARKWFRASNRVLKGQRPLDLLHSEYGARIVETILGRIDYGIYS